MKTWFVLLLFLVMVAPLLAQQADESSLEDSIGSEEFIMDESVEDLLSTELVTITSRQAQSTAEVPNIVTVITEEEIAQSGARTLGDALSLVPGIHVRHTSPMGIVDNTVRSEVLLMRGVVFGSNRQILIMIDGQRINNSQSGGTDGTLPAVPLYNVKRIEIIRGPGSSGYGTGAFVGVVNVITKTGRDIRGGSMVISAHNHGGKQIGLSAGNAYGDWSYSFHGLYSQEDGQEHEAKKSLAGTQTVTDGGMTQNADLRLNYQNLEFHYQQYQHDNDPYLMWGNPNPADDSSLFDRGYTRLSSISYEIPLSHGTIYASIGYSDFNAENVGVEIEAETLDYLSAQGSLSGNPSSSGGPPPSRQNPPPQNSGGTAQPSSTQGGTSSGTQPSSTQGSTNAGSQPAAGTTSSENFRNPSRKGRFVNENRLESKIDWLYTGFENHVWEIGFSQSRETLVNYGVFYNAQSADKSSTGSFAANDSDTTLTLLQNRTREISGVYAQDNYRMTTDLSVYIGARYDSYSDFGSTLNPRLGMVYRLTDQQVIKLLYGQAFRAPSLLEQASYEPMTGSLAEYDLDPEIINATEIAYQYGISRRMKFKINLFNNEIHNIIFANPGSVYNMSYMTSQGSEAELRIEFLPDHYFIFNASYATIAFPDRDSTVTNQLLPQTTANVIYNVPLFRVMNLNTSVSYRSEQKVEELAQETMLPAYVIANTHLTIHPSGFRSWEAFVGVTNLTNEEYYSPIIKLSEESQLRNLPVYTAYRENHLQERERELQVGMTLKF
ncbi:MAG: TonB-dependent receptor [SAR324 cluster bacterium]|nr:TonB-dependent receptor [SAR324 cluster bacterium]